MTAIVGILNTHAVAIAADSATTFSSNDNNVQKVHNKANKIFALSKKHSIGIAIFDSANFVDIPWETIIKMYRKELDGVVFNTVEDCKTHFISYLNTYLKYVTPESSLNAFYQHFNPLYFELTGMIEAAFLDQNANLSVSAYKAGDIQKIINDTLEQYFENAKAATKNPSFNHTLVDFQNTYNVQLDKYVGWITDLIRKTLPGYTFTAENSKTLKEIFYIVSLYENIYENSSGLVFIGYGENEIFPSSHLVYIGSLINKTIRHLFADPVMVKPIKRDGVILPYAQADVTLSILRGIDPTIAEEMDNSINKFSDDLISYMKPKFTDGDEPEKIKALAEGLIKQIKQYSYDKITEPIQNMLHCMDKEDMADLAESLVHITSLRRKFSETNESVGGPVDVAVITKGDGFIWTKRKQYIAPEANNHI